MKHKLSEIINTDCYIQFDSNEQLREWVKKAGIKLDKWSNEVATYIRFYKSDAGLSVVYPMFPHPIHHHTNISI
jgi:hypothetical protein